LSEIAVGFVTEREEHLNRAHFSFLSHLRHELGTPLTAITGFAYILLEGMDGPLSSTQTEDIQAMRDASQHLIDILNDLSDVYKIEMGRYKLQPRAFALRPLLQQISTEMQDVLSRTGNRLVVEVDARVESLEADKPKLERLLKVLLSHANWSTRNGRLTLRVTPVEREGQPCLDFHLTDTGTGLTSEQIAYLTHPQEETESLLALDLGGPGLGLLLCRRMSHFIGATFTAEGEIGTGSTYHLVIPAGG
jgi:signal transduction histidine kinase